MPIYAYRCAECGHAYDRLQKLSDPDPEICPECGASALKRQLTAPSFRLSGSGWYETDFKKEGDKKRNLTEGGEGAKPSSEGKSEGGKSEVGKSEGGKSEGGKPEGARTDAGKADGNKSDSGKSTEAKPAASSPAPAKPDSKPTAKPKPAAD